MAIFLFNLIGLGPMPPSFMYLIPAYTVRTCIPILKAGVLQATCQEYAMQALPQKQVRDLWLSVLPSAKEEQTVSHYCTYFLEGRDESVQVSIGKVPASFYISLDYPDSCLKQ